MAEAAPGPERIPSLDVVRGVAVMGILLANLPAFGLPISAYFSPLPAGGSGPAELAIWLANFVLVEGKMRGLFTFLFGASMLLVVERAEASGRDPLATHAARMGALFVLGLAHLYLVWWGDILAHYALVGMIAFAFRHLSTRALVQVGLLLLGISVLWSMLGWAALLESAARDTPARAAAADQFARAFGIPPASELAAEINAMRGSWADNFRWRQSTADSPLATIEHLGLQTLSAMLLGMAAFRSGLLTGEWSRSRYRRWAVISLGLALAGYLALGLATLNSGFDPAYIFLGSIVASQPLRIVGVVGYAALVILMMRPGGWITTRVAAVGRAAFTNYLGTSVIVTAIFYGWGLGLFSSLSRAQIYLVAPVVWLVMLAWSKPWLDRFAFGPMEWLWRSLARGRPQPLLRRAELVA